MNKFTKKLVLMGVVASMGVTMVACGEKAPAKDPAVVEESGEAHTHAVPFEWMAKMNFDKEGTYTIKINKNEGEALANIGFLKADTDEPEHSGAHMMDHESKKDHIHLGETLKAEHEYAYEIEMDGNTGEVKLEIAPNEYFVFFQHLPEEFDLEIIDPDGNKLEAKDIQTFQDGDEV